MVAALIVSVAFLTSYVIYHYHAGSVPFTGQGWIRPVYFFILITHVILAIVILPMVLRTAYSRLYRALRQARSHRAEDFSAMDVRFGHRCDRVPDALSDVGSISVSGVCR